MLFRVPLLIPSACARFHHDLLWQPESLLRLNYRNLVHVSDFSDGGHFAAFELPKELGNDIIVAINKMEMQRKQKK